MSGRQAQKVGVVNAAAHPPRRAPATPTAPYVCADCGRRFYNHGWHAEVCGSSNYKREDAA